MHLRAAHFIISQAVLFFLLISSPLYSIDNKPEDHKINNNDFTLFPRIGLLIEGRVFFRNDADYAMQTHRIFDIDILKIKNIFISFFLDESMLFNSKMNTRSIYYNMDFWSLRWENRFGMLSLFSDHHCLNIINENQTSDRMLRWYGYGLRWESYGMKPGRKDEKINFLNPDNYDLLNNFNYRLSAEKSTDSQRCYYKYMISGTLRYDIIRYYFLIPYIEGSFTILIGNNHKINRYFETGARMHTRKGDLTTFLGINHKYDTDCDKGNALDLYYIGLRLETLLSYENETESTESKEWTFFPDIHFSGSYAKFNNDHNLNFSADVLVEIDFFSSHLISPFFISRLAHNSLKDGSGLFPRYIQDSIETGASFRMEFINALAEPFYRYLRFDQGNFYGGCTKRFSDAGLRITSTTLKTGMANNGIDFDKAAVIEGINRIDWSISVARIIRENCHEYDWEYVINIRWNILRIYKSIPYVSAGLTLLKDDNYNRIYDIESGIRIQTGLYWMLFYKYEYRTFTDPVNGIYRSYHLTGIRFEI